ncbi:MAG: zinc ribbon domain-containing protein [Clostridiales bacterium]|nr:zinc ribbon domain-containing protein [Candidatus Cacconaster stercorequi]
MASEKAKAATDNAKHTMAIAAEQRELEKNYKAIGEWFASEFDGEIPDALKDIMAAVAASKAKIAELEADKGKKEETEEAPKTKVCPVCGVAAEGKFCPECGAPLGDQE